MAVMSQMLFSVTKFCAPLRDDSLPLSPAYVIQLRARSASYVVERCVVPRTGGLPSIESWTPQRTIGPRAVYRTPKQVLNL